MTDVFREFAYQAGHAISQVVGTISNKLDGVIGLLSSDTSKSNTQVLRSSQSNTTRAEPLVVFEADRGMSVKDGRVLTETEHLRQSLSDIFSTPIGSRVKRRSYGSNLPNLVDAPMNPSNELAIIFEAAESAIQWEPRIDVLQVQVLERNAKGRLVLGVAALDEAGNEVLLEVVA